MQHKSLDSRSKPWTGHFAQLDSYSRLQCHEALFSNVDSDRHTETSAFLSFALVTHSRKYFCFLERTVGGGYFSL